mmetsp:Transcript_23070/g.39640  ORF Transcript_23070/g.39640 Transcript_23070/m.39640 type:complete len:371 (+) Transcript_23070:127-1239(+)
MEKFQNRFHTLYNRDSKQAELPCQRLCSLRVLIHTNHKNGFCCRFSLSNMQVAARQQRLQRYHIVHLMCMCVYRQDKTTRNKGTILSNVNHVFTGKTCERKEKNIRSFWFVGEQEAWRTKAQASGRAWELDGTYALSDGCSFAHGLPEGVEFGHVSFDEFRGRPHRPASLVALLVHTEPRRGVQHQLPVVREVGHAAARLVKLQALGRDAGQRNHRVPVELGAGDGWGGAEEIVLLPELDGHVVGFERVRLHRDAEHVAREEVAGLVLEEALLVLWVEAREHGHRLLQQARVGRSNPHRHQHRPAREVGDEVAPLARQVGREHRQGRDGDHVREERIALLGDASGQLLRLDDADVGQLPKRDRAARDGGV